MTALELLSFISGVASGAIVVDTEAANRILVWLCRGGAFEPRLHSDGTFKTTVGFSNVLDVEKFPPIEKRQ